MHNSKYLLRRVASFHFLLKQGYKSVKLEKLASTPSRVIFASLGGTALACELLRQYIYDIYPCFPVLITRNEEELPFYSEKTLIVISSYSGNTEEILQQLKRSLNEKNDIVCISTGGILESVCHTNKVRHVKLPKPDFEFQPRWATFLFLGAMFAILEQYGVLESNSIHTHEILHYSPPLDFLKRKARRLSSQIARRIVVLFSYPNTIAEAVCNVARAKLVENSKTPAFCSSLPEACHNDIVAYKHSPCVFVFIFVINKNTSKRRRQRIKVLKRILRSYGHLSIIIELSGNNALNSMLTGTLLFDYISFYTAEITGVSISEIEAINNLKEALGISIPFELAQRN